MNNKLAWETFKYLSRTEVDEYKLDVFEYLTFYFLQLSKRPLFSLLSSANENCITVEIPIILDYIDYLHKKSLE